MTSKHCKACQTTFSIESGDKVFLEKFEVPEPTLCPPCRQQRRTAHVNQIYLFKRTCDGTGKSIVSNYPPESKCRVFSQEYWYGDTVDNTSFGKDFDFKRPFFDQFQELSQVVPRPALFTDYLRDENCAYTNYAGKNKDCYLIFDSDENRDCLYSYHVNSSINSVDCFRVEKVELCYEAVDSRNCYNCQYIYNCENCRDSALLQNCIGCKNCLLSSNLTQKQYYVFNEEVSKEKFEALWAQLQDPNNLKELKATFNKYRLQFPQKFTHGFQNEDVTGDYLVNSRSAHHCYDCRDLWDGRYVYQAFMKVKDCMDVNEGGDGELLYESTSIGYEWR